MYTNKELEYASSFWEYYRQYGNNIPDSVWERLGKVRERLGISWGRGHAIAKEVGMKGNPVYWMKVADPAPMEVFAGKEMEYAMACWEQYQRYGGRIPDKVWDELGKLREGLSISWGRGHTIAKEVSRRGNPQEWMTGNVQTDSDPAASYKEDDYSSTGQEWENIEMETTKETDEKPEAGHSFDEHAEPTAAVNAARSGRRRQAQQDLGLDDEREQARIERAMQKEEERRHRKEMRRMEIEESMSYKAAQGISKYMDKYFLDPILGFFMPGVGDFLTSVLVVPFIYVSAVKIRSLPLTLAVIFNVLRDVAIGLIPMWIGDILDCVNRGYLQNTRLIVGFVEDDKETIEKVNKKAVWMGIMIAVFCFIIYLLVKLAVAIAAWISDFCSSLFS